MSGLYIQHCSIEADLDCYRISPDRAAVAVHDIQRGTVKVESPWQLIGIDQPFERNDVAFQQPALDVDIKLEPGWQANKTGANVYDQFGDVS